MSIDVARHKSVAVITINRPEAMNALDPEHAERLGASAPRRRGFRVRSRRRIAGRRVDGSGRPGLFRRCRPEEADPQFRSAVRAGQSPPWNFGGFTAVAGVKPKIAAVNGHALAGGLEMALACDIRIASPNATFGLAETKWAIIPGAGGTARLPRTVPLGIALEMILTGEPIDAAEALRVGLVNRVVPLDGLVDEAMRIAQSIAERGPIAVVAAREAVLGGLGRSIDDALVGEYEQFLRVMRTDDAVEGATAFSEKRTPVYLGR